MTTVLTSGHKPANDLALEALRGLRTGTLYVYPRPPSHGFVLKRLVREIRSIKVKPWYFGRRLRRLGYRFAELRSPPRQWYHDLVLRLCDRDPAIADQIAVKQPSTGLIALAIGLADGGYERIIVSGFSFEITHAYAHNPLIDRLGTTRSKHADTDVMVLRGLVARHGRIYTTEPVVHAAPACRCCRSPRTPSRRAPPMHLPGGPPSHDRRRITSMVSAGLAEGVQSGTLRDRARSPGTKEGRQRPSGATLGFFENQRWQRGEAEARRSYESLRRLRGAPGLQARQDRAPAARRPRTRTTREFKRRFEGCAALREARSVLCLGARLGTEVAGPARARPFRGRHRPEPGRRATRYVLPGDFHAHRVP